MTKRFFAYRVFCSFLTGKLFKVVGDIERNLDSFLAEFPGNPTPVFCTENVPLFTVTVDHLLTSSDMAVIRSRLEEEFTEIELRVDSFSFPRRVLREIEDNE